jgi:hypothetical protein
MKTHTVLVSNDHVRIIATPTEKNEINLSIRSQYDDTGQYTYLHIILTRSELFTLTRNMVSALCDICDNR